MHCSSRRRVAGAGHQYENAFSDVDSSEVRKDETPRLCRECGCLPEIQLSTWGVWKLAGMRLLLLIIVRSARPEADPLKRGIEGCMPGTSGAEMPRGYNSKKDSEEAQTESICVVAKTG